MEHTTPASKAASAPTTQADTIAELRAKVLKLERERDNYKRAYDEWTEKTEWVQQTVQSHELGMHRADVLRERIARAALPVPRYKIGYQTDQWGERSSTPGGIPDQAGDWVRYDDHVAALASAAQPVKWWNGCDKTVPAALRYLADNERPIGGEARFNCAHLYQLADEIERMARLPLYTAPVPAAQGGCAGCGAVSVAALVQPRQASGC